MMALLTRREALLGAGAVAALSCALPLSARAQDTIALDQFLAVSARLTGAAAGDLDEDVAQKLLDGLLAMGEGPGLVLLAADPNVTTGTVADDIVAAWYSGVYDTQSGQTVATYNDALVWTALDFTKPQGSCGGAMGYWADPPGPS